MNDRNERTELQKRLAAELAEKAKKRAQTSDNDLPDGVTDSAFLKGTTRTTRLGWVWLLLGAAAVAVVIYAVIQSSGG